MGAAGGGAISGDPDITDHLTQVELIAAAKQGSRRAFGRLVNIHQDRLYRFLLVRSNCEADAQDALQEAFLSAFRSLRTYRSDWAFSTWLYRIGLRELARVARVKSSGNAADDAHSGVTCISDLDRDNLWAEVHQILSRTQFDVVWLMYAEGFETRAIARVLDKSVPWVKMTAYRARKKLSRTLTRDWREHHLRADVDTDSIEGSSHANV